MLLILAVIFASAEVQVQALHHLSPPCRNVTWACNSNTTCNSTYNQLSVVCADDFVSGNCSSSCRTTFMNLLKDPIGRDFDHCKCDSGENPCVNFEELCETSVPASTTCSVLQLACANSAFCGPLQMDYDRDCNPDTLFRAKNCTEACRRSYARLITNPIGKERVVCVCNETDQSCSQARSTVDKYCLGSTVKPPVVTGRIHTATPPTASPTIPPDNCLNLLDHCYNTPSCTGMLRGIMTNCTSASASSCEQVCKTLLESFVQTDEGTELALCSCQRRMERYSECQNFQTNFRNTGMYCNVTLPTHPPTPTKPTSGALGISFTTTVVFLFVTMAAY